jgi:hypothetical protein
VAIGREARSIDGAPLEGQPVKHCGRRLAAARAEKKTHSRGEHDRQPNSYGQQEVPAARRRGNDGGLRARRRPLDPHRSTPRCGPRRIHFAFQALQVRDDVRRGLIAHLAVFFERLVQDALQLRWKFQVQAQRRGRALWRMASKIAAEVLPEKACRPVAIS